MFYKFDEIFKNNRGKKFRIRSLLETDKSRAYANDRKRATRSDQRGQEGSSLFRIWPDTTAAEISRDICLRSDEKRGMQFKAAARASDRMVHRRGRVASRCIVSRAGEKSRKRMRKREKEREKAGERKG